MTNAIATTKKLLPVDAFEQFSPGQEVLVGSVEVEWWGLGPIYPFRAVDAGDDEAVASAKTLALPGVKSGWRAVFVRRGNPTTTDCVVRFEGGLLGPVEYLVPVGYIKPLGYPVEDPFGLVPNPKK